MQLSLFDIQNSEKLQQVCGQVEPIVRRYDSKWMIQRSNEIGRCKHGALCFVCEKVIHDVSWNNAPLCYYCFLQSLKQNYPERTLMIEHFESLIQHNSKYDILKNA